MVFCFNLRCYTVDNAIKLASDIFTEVSKKLSQQDIKVREYMYQCAIWFVCQSLWLRGGEWLYNIYGSVHWKFEKKLGKKKPESHFICGCDSEFIFTPKRNQLFQTSHSCCTSPQLNTIRGTKTLSVNWHSFYNILIHVQIFVQNEYMYLLYVLLYATNLQQLTLLE